MADRIKQDHNRFRQIVRGRVKKELRKYISRGEMIGRQGKELVSIPVPHIELPHFQFDHRQMGGVGQGDGEPGTPLGPGNRGKAASGAGDAPGEHILEADLRLDELAELLGEALQLPRIQPKGKKNVVSEQRKYTGIRQAGPESLRHFKRTYRQALKRQLISGTYDFEKPVIVPIREDKRYRSWQDRTRPESNAVIIYMMDVSGSMADEQKTIVRTEAFWIDTWLRSQYRGLERRYIIHDAVAQEVDEETFYHTRESGGTMISSAYRLCNQLIDRQFPADDWNIYGFHFSDGDNWGEDDYLCVRILDQQLLPKCNLFGYGQVENIYGGGHFISELKVYFQSEVKLITSRISSRDEIYDSIRKFLGTGR